eukprot:c28603_g1_i1 orf=317-2290(+)
MPGVLVGDQSVPFDAGNFNPIFENATVLTSGEDAKIISATPKSVLSELNGEDFVHGGFTADQNHLNVSSLYGTEYFHSPPLSPAERGSVRIWNVDYEDGIGPKVFPRSLSKLGSPHLVSMNEDLAFANMSGLFPENSGDINISLGLSCNTLKDQPDDATISIPMANAYEHSCSSGAAVGSPVLPDGIHSLHKFLPSNNEDTEFFPAVDVYSSDEFRMYEFKVRRCMRGRSHDWTECPFAHTGEKARRRDPRRFHYSGTACPDFRKGSCRRGDACEFAHGVFECWLHPARYRTQPCKDGKNCKRRVCFFAHTSEQFRFLPGSAQSISPSRGDGLHSPSLKASLTAAYDGSPLRRALSGSLDSALGLESLTILGLGQNAIYDGASDGYVGSPRSVHLGMANKAGLCCSLQTSSPTSTLAGPSFSPPPLSPPLSPSGSPTPLNSPDSSWAAAALSRLSAASNQSLSSPLQASLSQNAISQMQASVAACAQSSGPMLASTMATHGRSPLSPAVPAHRRHLDKLHSIPSVSIPCFEGRELSTLNSAGSMSIDKVSSSQAMNDLIVTLQQLELRARAAEFNRMTAAWSSKSPSLRFSHSVPSTPTKSSWGGQIDRWEVGAGMEPLPRVESGRDLRAKIYGRLCKEGPLENESPDIAWVNELVK